MDTIIIVNILWFGNLLSSRASILILDALGHWPMIIFIKIQPAVGALMAIFELKVLCNSRLNIAIIVHDSLGLSLYCCQIRSLQHL